VLAAAGLVPWTAFLAVSLPHRAEAEHYRLAWVGFDAAMFAVVGALAWIAYRRSTWTELLASSAATLLLVDAWFDVVTSPSRAALIGALVSAAVLELPLAGACLWLARNAEQVRRCGIRRLGGRSPRWSAG